MKTEKVNVSDRSHDPEGAGRPPDRSRAGQVTRTLVRRPRRHRSARFHARTGSEGRLDLPRRCAADLPAPDAGHRGGCRVLARHRRRAGRPSRGHAR
jgi:hypothetical protein